MKEFNFDSDSLILLYTLVDKNAGIIAFTVSCIDKLLLMLLLSDMKSLTNDCKKDCWVQRRGYNPGPNDAIIHM